MTERDIAELWTKMARIFGHRWTSGFGEADDGTWLAALRGLTPEQLVVGVHACIHGDFDWPPGLPEFRRLCLRRPVGVVRNQQPSQIESREQVERRRQIAKAHLERARDILGS